MTNKQNKLDTFKEIASVLGSARLFWVILTTIAGVVYLKAETTVQEMSRPMVQEEIAKSEARIIKGFVRIERILAEGGFDKAIQKVNSQEFMNSKKQKDYEKRLYHDD